MDLFAYSGVRLKKKIQRWIFYLIGCVKLNKTNNQKMDFLLNLELYNVVPGVLFIELDFLLILEHGNLILLVVLLQKCKHTFDFSTHLEVLVLSVFVALYYVVDCLVNHLNQFVCLFKIDILLILMLGSDGCH